MTFASRKPWTRPHPLIAKAQTRMLVDKGPARNTAWLARIRALPCLCCPHGHQQQPSEAHHPKGLFPRTLGKRISDYTVVPLCRWHHRDSPDALHSTGDELAWWRGMGVDPIEFLRSSKEGRSVIALMEKKNA